MNCWEEFNEERIWLGCCYAIEFEICKFNHLVCIMLYNVSQNVKLCTRTYYMNCECDGSRNPWLVHQTSYLHIKKISTSRQFDRTTMSTTAPIALHLITCTIIPSGDLFGLRMRSTCSRRSFVRMKNQACP
jgi:hypothetical protein